MLSYPLTLNSTRNNLCYRIQQEDLDRYWERIKILEMKTQVWPPTLQVQHLCHKWELTKRLDFISDEMGLPRPTTQVLTRGCDIPSHMVMKRTHSDCGSRVLFPSEGRSTTWEDLVDESEPPESVWMAQELVPHLRKLGEWRSILVNGELIYVVHTIYDETKGSWGFSKVDRFYTLDDIR